MIDVIPLFAYPCSTLFRPIYILTPYLLVLSLTKFYESTMLSSGRFSGKYILVNKVMPTGIYVGFPISYLVCSNDCHKRKI